jgi:uncharacterized glyoxalase superfamily protein PhnB
MPKDPPNGMPRITPNLFYDDPGAAIEFLGKSFGLELRNSIPAPDGGILHAEMQVHEAVVMMSPTSSSEAWRSPQTVDGHVTMGLYVFVDDIDAHCARARAAGPRSSPSPRTCSGAIGPTSHGTPRATAGPSPSP